VELQISFPRISYSICCPRVSEDALVDLKWACWPSNGLLVQGSRYCVWPHLLWNFSHPENFPGGTCLSCVSDSWMTYSHSFASPSLSADQCAHPGKPKQKILTFHCSLLLLRSLGSQTNIYQPTAVKITSLPLKDKQRSRNAVSRVLITLVSDILANAECNLVSIELDWQIHSIFTEWISKIYDSILPG